MYIYKRCSGCNPYETANKVQIQDEIVCIKQSVDNLQLLANSMSDWTL